MRKNAFTSVAVRAESRRNTIRSFKASANKKRTFSERISDRITVQLGSVSFLLLNALLFLFWILWNLGKFPGISPIDPFPFSLLTMVVSLEAIFLSVIVLISQNREARIADLREEMELYINTYSENEITKLMYLLTVLLEKNGVDLSTDNDLKEMLENIDSDAVERELEKQLSKV